MSDSDDDTSGESTEADSVSVAQASSTFKVHGELSDGSGAGVLGENTASTGTPIGVEGAVPNAPDGGYGLSTPHDARIEGAIDTAGNSFRVHAATMNQHPNVVLGHPTNEVASGVTGATISGGGYEGDTFDWGNAVVSENGTIGGGIENVAGGPGGLGDFATVGGGRDNEAAGTQSTIGGGARNETTGSGSTIAGGKHNLIDAKFATIAGGGASDTSNASSTRNAVHDDYGTIGGGGNNSVGTDDADETNAMYGTVGGGRNNAAERFATVGGGRDNDATTSYTTVAGGRNNTAEDSWASVGGGQGNVASGENATVAGGFANEASANYATVPGGYSNVADAEYGFATGRKADLGGHIGSFVVGDGSPSTVTANQDHEVVFQSDAIRFANELPAGSGSQVGILLGGKLVDNGASSARYKEDIESLDSEDEAVLDLEPKQFEYTETGDEGVGFIAESVDEHVPDLVVRDEDGRPDGVRYDRLGVYLQPEVGENRDRLEALETAIEEKDDRIEELEARNDHLAERLATLEERLASMDDGAPTSAPADD